MISHRMIELRQDVRAPLFLGSLPPCMSRPLREIRWARLLCARVAGFAARIVAAIKRALKSDALYQPVDTHEWATKMTFIRAMR